MPKISTPPAEAVVLTVPQFLSRYGIGRDLFYDEVRAGRLAILKVGSRTLVSKEEASRWLASKEVCQVA